jgi:hypothetical protein
MAYVLWDKMNSGLPETLPGRIEFVGEKLYGRDWRDAVAHLLGVHRATLWRWLAGMRTSHDIDAALVALLEAARGVAAARSVEIGLLQRALLAFVKRDSV